MQEANLGKRLSPERVPESFVKSDDVAPRMKQNGPDAATFELAFQPTNEAGSEPGPLERGVDRHRAEPAAREVVEHAADDPFTFGRDEVQRAMLAREPNVASGQAERRSKNSVAEVELRGIKGVDARVDEGELHAPPLYPGRYLKWPSGPLPAKSDRMSATFAPSGVFTALVTPFQDDGTQAIDVRALDRLVDDQLEAGVDGLVPCGTTGESPTLSSEEQAAVIAQVAVRARGKAKVLAGTGTNATRSTIELSQAAVRAGADAVMIVVPYYNKPTQEGLVRHFVAVARAVSCPVVIYNIPGRTGVDLLPDAVAQIVDSAANVVGMKESTGNVLRAQELVRRFGNRLAVMCGDDALTLPMMASGARGVISVTSNLMPKEVCRLVRLAEDGRFGEARGLHLSLLPVHEAMFLESNPAPVKAALALADRMTDVVRSPLVRASVATRTAIQAALALSKRGMA